MARYVSEVSFNPDQMKKIHEDVKKQIRKQLLPLQNLYIIETRKHQIASLALEAIMDGESEQWCKEHHFTPPDGVSIDSFVARKARELMMGVDLGEFDWGEE